MRRRVPRHDMGRTRTGRVVHAVEHDPSDYTSTALCGVTCTTVDRRDVLGFDPFAWGSCSRCAVMFWRTVGTSGAPSRRLEVWNR